MHVPPIRFAICHRSTQSSRRQRLNALKRRTNIDLEQQGLPFGTRFGRRGAQQKPSCRLSSRCVIPLLPMAQTIPPHADIARPTSAMSEGGQWWKKLDYGPTRFLEFESK